MPPAPQQPVNPLAMPYLPGYPAQDPGPALTGFMGNPAPPTPEQYGFRPMGAPYGGLDLSAIAGGNEAETQARLGGLTDLFGLVTADDRRRAAAELAGANEASGRERDTHSSEAQRDRDLEASMNATARAFQERQAALTRSLNARLGRGGSGEPNWFDQQKFETDENIRQAAAIAAIQAQYEQGGAQGQQPHLSDFGESQVDPYRGRALLAEGQRRPSVQYAQSPQFTRDIEAVRNLLYQNSAYADPALAQQAALGYFANGGAGRKWGGRSDELASIALAQMGYFPA